MAKIKDLKKKYKGEWLVIEVTKEEEGEAVDGKLILRSKNREEIWRKVKPSKTKQVYVTFAGPPLEKGFAAAFYENK